MGLDACVYKNRETLLREFGPRELLHDVMTGEWYHRDDAKDRIHWELFRAVVIHLGNLMHIVALREEIEELGLDVPMISGRVIYDGLHAGDQIELTEVDQLEAEAKQLRGVGSALLQALAADLLRLVQAAREQRNPIVF